MEFLIPYAKKDKPWTHKQIVKLSPGSLWYALDTAYLMTGKTCYRDLRDQLRGKSSASLTYAK